jgi:hypothetical protein
MAKTSSKAQAIRDAIKADRHAKAKEIVATLATKGIKVTTPHVYMIKSQLKQKQRKANRAKAVETSRQAGSSNPVSAVLSVRKLAMDLGGLKNLKALVDVLSE